MANQVTRENLLVTPLQWTQTSAQPGASEYWKAEFAKVKAARQQLNERHKREIDWERTRDEAGKLDNVYRVASVEFGERWIVINRQCPREELEERRKCVVKARDIAAERRRREEEAQAAQEERVTQHLYEDYMTS